VTVLDGERERVGLFRFGSLPGAMLPTSAVVLMAADDSGETLCRRVEHRL
jgi:hypothetical protein